MQPDDAVLITGAAGDTASRIIDALDAAGWTITGLDLPGTPRAGRVDRWVAGSVLDRDVLLDAIPLGGVVVHAAVSLDHQDYDQVTPAVATNVAGAYLVFDAARARHARRVVLLSSAPVHVVGDDATWASSPGGDHLYDVTKRLQEEVARDFVETYGLAVTVLRLGHVVDAVAGISGNGQPLEDLAYCRGGWVSRCGTGGGSRGRTGDTRSVGVPRDRIARGQGPVRDRRDRGRSGHAVQSLLTPRS